MLAFLLVAGSLHKETSRSIRPEHPPTRACVRLYQREGAHPWGICEGSRRPAGGGDKGRSSVGGVNDRGRGPAAGGGEGGRGRAATEAGRERVLAAGGTGPGGGRLLQGAVMGAGGAR